MTQETGMQLFKPLSKDQQESVSVEIWNGVLSGDIDPVEITVRFKAWINIMESVTKLIKEKVNDELAKYPEKTVEIFGAEISKSARRNFDYTVDSIWSNLNSIEKNNATKRKARENFLKAISKPDTLDPETGELINPLGYGETIIHSIKFK